MFEVQFEGMYTVYFDVCLKYTLKEMLLRRLKCFLSIC